MAETSETHKNSHQGNGEINLTYIGATNDEHEYNELRTARSDGTDYQIANARTPIVSKSEVIVTRRMIVLAMLGSLLISTLISVIVGITVYHVTIAKMEDSDTHTLQNQQITGALGSLNPTDALSLTVRQLENNLTAEMTSLKNNLTAHSDEMTSLKNNLTAHSDVWTDEMTSLKTNLTTEMTSLKNNLTTVSDVWTDEMTSFKDNLTAHSDVWNDDMTSLKNNLTAHSDEITSLKNNVSELKTNLNTTSDVWNDKMTSLKSNLTAHSDVWNDEITSLKSNVSELKTNLNTTSGVWIDEITSLKSNVSELKNNLNTTSVFWNDEMTSLKSNVSELKNNLTTPFDAWTDEMTSVKSSVLELKSNLAAASTAWKVDLASRINISLDTRYSKGCSELYAAGAMVDGVYTISPDGRCSFHVYCDMTGGGWTLIQKRINGNVSFNRPWDDYVAGFGNIDGEHWLGLDKIHRLTADGSEIYFHFEYYDDRADGFAHYKSFIVHDAIALYRMNVDSSGYNGTIGELFSYQNNRRFSTYDRDHDSDVGNCATSNDGGAWWYNACSRLGNLNGVYGKRERGGIAYWGTDTKMVPVKNVHIKIKPLIGYC